MDWYRTRPALSALDISFSWSIHSIQSIFLHFSINPLIIILSVPSSVFPLFPSFHFLFLSRFQSPMINGLVIWNSTNKSRIILMHSITLIINIRILYPKVLPLPNMVFMQRISAITTTKLCRSDWYPLPISKLFNQPLLPFKSSINHFGNYQMVWTIKNWKCKKFAWKYGMMREWMNVMDTNDIRMIINGYMMYLAILHVIYESIVPCGWCSVRVNQYIESLIKLPVHT